MRRGTWLIWLVVLTFLSRTAFAAAPDFCTMPGNQMAHTSVSYQQLPETDHAAMQHNPSDVQAQSEQGCCADSALEANCMVSGYLLIMPLVVDMPCPPDALPILYFAYAASFPQSPYFPLLRPPIA